MQREFNSRSAASKDWRIVGISYLFAAVSMVLDYFSHFGEREVVPIWLVQLASYVAVGVWVSCGVSFLYLSATRKPRKQKRKFREITVQEVLWLVMPFAYLGVISLIMMIEEIHD